MADDKQGFLGSVLIFLRATVVGGVLFLLPLVLVVMILGHAMRIALHIARPIAEQLHWETASGVGAATLLAIGLLVLVSFLAGIVARTRHGRRATNWFENSMLGGMPQYQLMKSMADGLSQFENTQGVKPVLVSIEEGWQVAYLLEELEQGWVAVFIPQAPTPMSGNVMYFPVDRIRPLDMSMIQAMALIKRIGVGSGNALKGVDLRM